MDSQASDLIASFNAAGQGHVFRFFEALSAEEQSTLLEQAATIDLAEVGNLNETLVQVADDHGIDLEGLEPAPFIALPEKGGDAAIWAEAHQLGEEALRAGRVAAFTVAGGQGTRLGYDGPKGTFPVTPVEGHTLFQVFAEKIQAASKRYGKSIYWYVMTSNINHEATVAFFEEHAYFGLSAEVVRFFRQGLMPAVDAAGKIMLESKGSISMSPDGHGGSLRALVRSGAIAEMESMGVDIISYFQVDNPLVKCIDPAFIGFHVKSGSQMSSKALPKAYAKEKVGHFCIQKGTAVVIEYSDMPDALVEQTDQQGELLFNGGSIAIHIFDRNFVKKMGGDDASVSLPFHRADKKIKTIDDAGNSISPESPNGIKFEMFVFDALPFAERPLIIETARSTDFSPVKNAEGVDSPQSSKEDQMREFATWFKAAGVPLETDDSGLPAVSIEVSPLFADNEQAFIAAWNALAEKPEITAGLVLR